MLNHAAPALQDIPYEDSPPVEVFAQLGVPSSQAGLRITVKDRLIFTPRAIYEKEGQYYELNSMYRWSIGSRLNQHIFLGGGAGLGWQDRRFGMTYVVGRDIEPVYYSHRSARGFLQVNYIYDFKKLRLQAAVQLARYKHLRWLSLENPSRPHCNATGNELPTGWLYSFSLASKYRLGAQNTLSLIATGNLNYYDQCVHAEHSPLQLGVQISHRFKGYK